MSNFTPGPWRYDLARWTPDTKPFGYTVKAVGRDHPVASDGVYLHTSNGVDFSSAEIEANARLIAAAPTILGALKTLQEWLRYEVPAGTPSAATMLREVNAAIAQAQQATHD